MIGLRATVKAPIPTHQTGINSVNDDNKFHPALFVLILFFFTFMVMSLVIYFYGP